MEKFSYEKNGYNRSEVNSFVSEVIHETEKLLVVIKHQKKEIEELKLELNECKLKQNELNDIIESTEKMKKEINTLLEEKKELIINTAKHNASKIVNDALIEANKLEKRKRSMEKEIAILKSNIKNIIRQQQEIIDDIDNN